MMHGGETESADTRQGIGTAASAGETRSDSQGLRPCSAGCPSILSQLPGLNRRRLLSWPLGVTTALFCRQAFGQSVFRQAAGDGQTSGDAAPSDEAAKAASTPSGAGTHLLADDIFKQHLTGPGHPERPERCDAVLQGLKRAGSLDRLPKIKRRRASEDEILLCHGGAYLETVQRDVAAGARTLSTGDTAVSERSFEIALEAVGGVLNAVDAVVSRQARNAFCVVRPPGHHARPDQGMGFCIFNNIAIGARYAQRRLGLARVLIADWDVHHGNGTQDIFYRDGSVFFFSTHQSPWYPGTGMTDESGDGAGAGTTMNFPLPAGSGRTEIGGAFRNALVKAADEFRPELVMISAGFDSRLGDPLGHFRLGDQDFAELTALMLDIADRHAGGRLVSVLEGGYDLEGLGSAAAHHVEALLQA